MMAAKIKKGDTVIVLTGRDKGRSGEVLRVIPSENRVVVDGVNMVKKHKRPSPASAGGIESMAAPIHISNVAHKDPQSGKATRIGFRILEDGRKVRFAKASGEVIDR
ncbi:MAG TPA: 50S ribosomal protein L24 [Alphaproteobacteria bacterium]|nr:50S ribosomal protein L24 [Alphaproteobacteria bacterium]